MGLISDYLEQCRDRCNAGDLDPCLIISRSVRNQIVSYHDIHRAIAAYSRSKNDDQKKLLKQQLLIRSSELETIKSGYLMGEKIVLSVWNSGKLQSNLMLDTIQLLLSELRRYYQAICDLRQDINKELGDSVIVQFNPPLESDIRKKILKTIGTSLIVYLQDNSTTIDYSVFRKIVFDFAEIIRSFEQEEYNQPAKKIVRYHLERDFNLKEGHLRCSDCKEFLLEDIPYCFNCFGRN